MGKGRFASSLLAVGTLLFFTNLEMAWADDVRWIATHTDGICTAPIPTGQPAQGGGGCGFLWIHCISRVARDTYAAATGTAMGLFIGVGAALAIGALIASAPIWLTVGAVAAGVALTGYGIYSTVKGWNRMNEQQKIYTVGMWGGSAFGGGLGAHYAPLPAEGAPGDGAAGASADRLPSSVARNFAQTPEQWRANSAALYEWLNGHPPPPGWEPGPMPGAADELSAAEGERLWAMLHQDPAVEAAAAERAEADASTRPLLTLGDLFREATGSAPSEARIHGEDPAAALRDFPGSAWRGGAMPESDAWQLARWVYDRSVANDPYGGLGGIHDLMEEPGLTEQAVGVRMSLLLSRMRTGRGRIDVEYVYNDAWIPGLDQYRPGQPGGNYAVWDEATNTITFRRGVTQDPAAFAEAFGHVYGEILLGKAFGGASEVPRVQVSGGADLGPGMSVSRILDLLVQEGS